MCRWDVAAWPPHACGDVINWGDVPTWLAFIAAVAAGIAALVLLRVERRRDRAAEDEARRRQAEQVSGWVAPVGATWVGLNVDNESFLHADALSQLLMATELIAVNRSDQPVTDVRVIVGASSPWEQKRWIPVLPPAADFRQALAPVNGESAFQDITAQGSEDPTGARRPHLGWATALSALPVSLKFTDAAGRRWQRAADGQLAVIDPTRNG